MNVSYNSKNNFPAKRGFLMMEVLVGIAIIVVTILVAMNVAQQSIYLSRQSVHQAQAAFLLEEGAEVVRIVRDNAWANISGLTLSTNYYPLFSGGTWTLSSTPSQVGIFNRTIVLAQAFRDGSQNLATSGTLDIQTKLVTVSVSWVGGGQTFTKNLQFYITDLFS